MPDTARFAAGLNRRESLKRLLALSFAAALGSPLALKAAPLRGDPRPFGIDRLRRRAAQLATTPFQAPREKLPVALRELTGDDYREIRYRPPEALWLGEAPFTTQFFHPGYYYQNPVRIFEVLDDQAREVLYAPALFDFGKNHLGSGAFDQVNGFAGFRIHYALNDADYLDELVAFLGASYFRALGRGMQYGLSARGLAIGTASAQGEEFPYFSEFYLERPIDANSLVIHALLNSQSCTGAYTFTVRPGEATVIDVNFTLYTRKQIDLVGIAPLTSMFFFAANDRVGVDDYRPEVHDSDGLLIWNGSGEWIWRSLVNPRRLRISSFMDHNPKGFGLMQRNRQFAGYEDSDSHYERRPGAWVEPVGDWGAGAVVLVEIPTDSEGNDNIVAMWRPESPLGANAEWQATYRLHWCAEAPVGDRHLATVAGTRVGTGRGEGARKFVVDFRGGKLPKVGLEAVVSTSRGVLTKPTMQWNASDDTWRVFFDLLPEGDDPIELRCYLKADQAQLTETWSYQWTE